MISITQEMIMHNWKSKETLVSIRCVTYNQEKYISQALDSFLMQKTNFPFEIVVHDDASTDKTIEIPFKVFSNSAINFFPSSAFSSHLAVTSSNICLCDICQSSLLLGL